MLHVFVDIKINVIHFFGSFFLFWITPMKCVVTGYEDYV